MIYFLLPHNYSNAYQYLDCIKKSITETPDGPCLSESLHTFLFEIKEKLNEYPREWDTYKKITNPYEYIHTVCPPKKKCLSKYKPLSRSYFKLIEIYSFFGMNFGDAPIKTFHLAEGPGGFIEATAALRSNPLDVYVGMTLQDSATSTDIPSWKKSNVFLKENPNVIIENGANGTGDILSVDNFVYCCEKYRSSMEFITGDGGFDFTENFNEQEQDIGQLLFAQIAFAVCMQKHRGTFVLKIFDFFLSHTIDLLFLLSSFYEKVYITKPDTSRYANSEKYLVCTGFRYENCDAFYPVFLRVFISMAVSVAESMDSVPCVSVATGVAAVPYESVVSTPSLKVVRFLNKPISYFFKMKLEEFNSCFGQQQIESIFLTITIIECNNEKNKNNKINELIKNNMQKCMNWCIKYNVPYNVF